MTLTILILVLTVSLFVWGRPRADITALCALALLLLSGILTPAEALAGFSNQVVIMMAGLFVVGGAILQTGLAKAASQRIMHVAGHSTTAMFLLVVLVTAAIGAFVSNTGTVALMMPIVVSMAAQTGRNASGLLMPLAFASSMGGMLTLIGTPPNLVIDEALRNQGMPGLSFFSFLPVGLICLAVGILVMLPLSRIFLNKKTRDKASQGKTTEQLVDEYKLAGNIYAFRVDARSSVVGRTVRQLNLRARHGISIIEIRQDSSRHGRLLRNITQSMPIQDQKMHGGDILYLQGSEEEVRQFASAASLHPLSHSGLDFYDIGIAEIVVMPESRLVGLTLRDSQLREQYQINVLGIRRSHAYISDSLPELRLKAGDTLLIQGLWSNLEKIDQEENGWVLLGKPREMAEKVTIGYRAPLAAFIMVLMVAAMVFDFIPVHPVTAVMVAAAYKTINWESLVLIAAMMPMATALEKTGVSAIVSHSLVTVLGSLGPTALLCGVYFTTSLLTMFISNAATAVLMAPIAMRAASGRAVSPLPFLFAVTLGASMCFASPFSTPPNALVMQAGGYTFADYAKVGLPLQLAMGVVMTLVLPWLFPF